MTHPNEILIRSGYEAFKAGDIPGVLKIFASDISWTIPGRSPLAGTYTGPDEVLSFFQKLAEQTAGTFELELIDVLAGDKHVAAIVKIRAQRGDRTLDTSGVHLWTIANGHATRFVGLPQDQYVDDEFFA